MPSFDTQRYCYKCRESGKGDYLCTVKKDCLLCVDFSEDHKWKLAEKLSKGKKSVKETALQKEKIDDSILDEEDSKQPIPSYSETLFTIKKWLDIAITEADSIIALSVFSQASKLKKSAEVSLALPPAENMVSLEFQGIWGFGCFKGTWFFENQVFQKESFA